MRIVTSAFDLVEDAPKHFPNDVMSDTINLQDKAVISFTQQLKEKMFFDYVWHSS